MKVEQPGGSMLVVDDPLFDEHRSPGVHPERPERLAAARRAVATCEREGIRAVALAPRDANDDELARAHDEAYLATLTRYAGRQGALDADTYLAPRSVAAARRAAGSAIRLVDSLLQGDGPRLGVALLRPPGHHATPDRAMGFCLLNNAAVAAHAALAAGLSRVAIVDWDVHHGNGTQDIFWSDPRVLYVSLHQAPFYPGTGAVDEAGRGDGAGYTVNVPLSEDADDAVYEAAFHEIVRPVLGDFAPELILISAGFDAHERDPLAAMRVTERGYEAMARTLLEAARETAGGRLGLLLEGGYDLEALEHSLAASIRALVGAAPAEPAARAGAVDSTHRDELTRARQGAKRAWRSV